MIMPEENVLKALKICSSHDKARCAECPYHGWCGNTVNPNMNMQMDALEIISRLKTILYAAELTVQGLNKQLAKANRDRERYGKRIREQREEILDLRAMLDGAIAGQETLQRALAKADRCVSCGDVIPEGRQVCPSCLTSKEAQNDTQTLC